MLATGNNRLSCRVDVRPKALCILTIPRGLKGLVERERHITWNGEIIKCNVGQSLAILSVLPPLYGRRSIYLLCITSTHRRLDLPEAFADEQGSVDKHAVGGTVDLKVAEQHTGTEEGQDLIDTIVGLVVGRDVDVGGIRGQRGQSVCGTPGASAQRQDREVPCNQCQIRGRRGRPHIRICAYEGRPRAAVGGASVPITGTSRSSRKMEWYA